MYIASGGFERVYDYSALSYAFEGVPELAMRTDIPDLRVIQTGDQRLTDRDGELNPGSIGYRLLHSVYLDKSLTKSQPLPPDEIAVCVTTAHQSHHGVPHEAILDYLQRGIPEEGDDRFDVSMLNQGDVDATVIMAAPSDALLPEAAAAEGKLNLTRPMIHKLAALSLAHALPKAPPTLVADIEKFCQPDPSQPRPSPFESQSSRGDMPYYYWGIGNKKYGLAIVASRQFTNAEFTRVSTPIAK